MENFRNIATIYKLTCIINNKIYIGKAVNLYNRLRNHRNSQNYKEGKCYLQNAIKKYGWSSFIVEILETFDEFNKERDKDKILEREAYYIQLFDATNSSIGYNLCKYSNDRTGVPCSEKTKIKMSNASKGRPKSREAVEKMRQTKLGKSNGPHTPETIEKIRQSKLGKKRAPFSKEAIENMKRDQAKRAPMSEETKEKISMSSKGKPKSREAVEKMRAAKIGRRASEETKEKMRASHRKRIQSNITKLEQ